MCFFFFFSSRRRHTRCALVTGVQTCALPIWRYPPWRGVFYPKGLPQRCELDYASRQLNSIEINGTFYALQRPDSFRRWRAETPDDFVFAIKEIGRASCRERVCQYV